MGSPRVAICGTSQEKAMMLEGPVIAGRPEPDPVPCEYNPGILCFYDYCAGSYCKKYPKKIGGKIRSRIEE